MPPRPRRPDARARPPVPAPTPLQVRQGDQLCRLEVWTEAEYRATAPDQRPAAAAFCPALGWVVAVPEQPLN